MEERDLRIVIFTLFLYILSVPVLTATLEETRRFYCEYGGFYITFYYPQEAYPNSNVNIKVELKSERKLYFRLRIIVICGDKAIYDKTLLDDYPLDIGETITRTVEVHIPKEVSGYMAVLADVGFYNRGTDYTKIRGVSENYAQFWCLFIGTHVINKELETLRKEYTDLQIEYNKLFFEHNILQEKYDSLLTAYDKLTAENEKLKAKLSTLNSTYLALKDMHKNTLAQLNNYMFLTYTLSAIVIGLIALIIFLTYHSKSVKER